MCSCRAGADASGFVDLKLDGDAWRVYYLQSPRGEWLVAAGQALHERDELVWNLVTSQLLPWLLVLPVLMLAMAWAVRQALAPVRALTAELQRPRRRRPAARAGRACAGRTAAPAARR